MAEKDFDHGDPFKPVAIELEGCDQDVYLTEMARTFIEEYMRVGYSDEVVLGLFRDPYYQAPHQVMQSKGEAFVKKIIDEVRHG